MFSFEDSSNLRTTEVRSKENLVTNFSNDSRKEKFMDQDNIGLSDVSADEGREVDINFDTDEVEEDVIKNLENTHRLKLHKANTVNMQLRYDSSKFKRKIVSLEEKLQEKDNYIEMLEKKVEDGEEYLVRLENLLKVQERPNTPKRAGRASNRIIQETNSEIIQLSQQFKQKNVLTEALFSEIKEEIKGNGQISEIVDKFEKIVKEQFTASEIKRREAIVLVEQKSKELEFLDSRIDELKGELASLQLDRVKDQRQIQLLEMELKTNISEVKSEKPSTVKRNKITNMKTYTEKITKRIEKTLDLKRKDNKKFVNKVYQRLYTE